MTTLTINAGFNKRVREPHKKARIIHKNIVGIKVTGFEWPADEVKIRHRVDEYKPGHDWMLTGYNVTRIDHAS